MASNYPPKKNSAFTMYFFVHKSDGTIIANPTLTGSNVHVDGSTTEITNSTLAVVDATSGLCSIALAQATMNGDQIDGTITSSSTGAVVEKFKLMTSAYTNDEIGANIAALHTHIDTLFDGTGVVSLKSLSVVNSTGDAVVFGSSGSNGRGLYAYGNGSGDGVKALGGATGNGLYIVGGATSGSGLAAAAISGDGIFGYAGASGAGGVVALGQGAAVGFHAEGGATGHGARFHGGATSGAGLFADSHSGDGILAVGAGTGKADINGDITGNLTGYVSGSVGSVTSFGTLVADIVTATGAAATWGLAALKTLLVTTGIKVATNADKTGYSGTATNMVAEAPTAGAINTALEAAHGVGVWGTAAIGAGTTINQTTLDTAGIVLGRVMPYGTISVYLADTLRYQFDADADGDFSYVLPTGSIWTLTARHPGYRTTIATVSTIPAVS
jgi:hypothetical protein